MTDQVSPILQLAEMEERLEIDGTCWEVECPPMGSDCEQNVPRVWSGSSTYRGSARFGRRRPTFKASKLSRLSG